MASQRTAWTATIWGNSTGVKAERLSLKKGEDVCNICMEARVEVMLKPCSHLICLECCNRLRAANIFKVDAGIRCPLCRDYVEQFTDLHGNPSSVPSLRAANDAAAKSLAARNAGAQSAVSTSVPDPVRLVPSVAPRSEPTWSCDKCLHINNGNREACNRCRCTNPNFVRPSQYATLDPLSCDPEQMANLLTERGHHSLKKALADAGTPLTQKEAGGTAASVRDALKVRGHERVLRIAAAMVAEPKTRLLPAACDVLGNYGVQRLLECLHKVRGQAQAMAREGAAPTEDLTATQGVSTQSAFPRLVAALGQLAPQLARHENGVHTLVKVVALSGPAELLPLARAMAVEFPSYCSDKGGVFANKEASIYMCNMISKVCGLCFESSAAAAPAADALNELLVQYRHNCRLLNAHARHQYLGPALTEAVQGALPRPDAFRACHILACNAEWIASSRSGAITLTLLLSLTAQDTTCRAMVRDIACTTALSLRGKLGEAAIAEEGVPLVQTLLEVMVREREDVWVRGIVAELVRNGRILEGEEDTLHLLCAALSNPQITEALLAEHLTTLEKARADVATISSLVQENRQYATALPPRVLPSPSEIQPSTDMELAKRRLPPYVWDLVTKAQARNKQQQQHPHQHGGSGNDTAAAPAAASNGGGDAGSNDAASTAASLAHLRAPGPATGGVYSNGGGVGHLPQELQPNNAGYGYSWNAMGTAGNSYISPASAFASAFQTEPEALAPPMPPQQWQAPGPSAAASADAAAAAHDPCSFFPQFAQPLLGGGGSSSLQAALYGGQQAQQHAAGSYQNGSGAHAGGAQGFTSLMDMLESLGGVNADSDAREAAPAPPPMPPPGFLGQSSMSIFQPAEPPVGTQGGESVRPQVIMRFGSGQLEGSPVQPAPHWAAPDRRLSGQPQSPPRQAVLFSAAHNALSPQQAQRAPTSVPPSPAQQAQGQQGGGGTAPQYTTGDWNCTTCTYEHLGKEAQYLVCAVCGAQRPQIAA